MLDPQSSRKRRRLGVSHPAARLALIAETDLHAACAAARAAEPIKPARKMRFPADHPRQRIDVHVTPVAARRATQFHMRVAVIAKAG